MTKKLKTISLPSVQNFKNSIDETNKLITSVIANITATETLLTILSKTDKKILDNPVAKSLKLENNEKQYIYELGFVALFANFEAFSHQIIKDLIYEFPKCLTDSDKTIKLSEVLSLRSGRKIRDFVVDEIAIENSSSIEKWALYLKNKFNIEALPSQKTLDKLCILNELRNIFLHSGGVTTALFIRKVQRYIKPKIPLNKKVDFVDRERYFKVLHECLVKIHSHIAGQ